MENTYELTLSMVIDTIIGIYIYIVAIYSIYIWYRFASGKNIKGIGSWISVWITFIVFSPVIIFINFFRFPIKIFKKRKHL